MNDQHANADETGNDGAAAWLMVSVSTAGAPAALRVTTWRRLKELGALYLQQSVCLLPHRPAVQTALGQLTDRIRSGGGTARVLTVAVTDPAQQAELVDELCQARNTEYNEVLERFPSFFKELSNESARGRATFEEVEESEADLARFRAWLRKIAARDYFQANLGPQARAELKRAEDALARFTELAMYAEAPPEAAAAEHG
jgi:hypothetical protein